ncbi:MAG: hypothetical protein ACRBFS_03140 [Aureispira sp.]
MTHFCLFLILLFCGESLQAQKATKEALQRACNCLDGTNLEKGEGLLLTMRVDSCLEEGLYVNLSGVLREQKASIDNDSSMFALAQYLQDALTRNCSSFREAAKSLASNQLEEVKVENQRTKGLLYQFNTNQQFPIFVVITPDYKLENFLWFHEFDGSTRFMKGIKPYLYTPVEIVWREVELYDRVNGRYPYYKEILLIEEQEKIDKKSRKAWIKAYERSSKRKD